MTLATRIHIMLGSALVVLLMAADTVRGQVATAYAVVDLGTLGGSESRAYGLNDAGQVVGSSRTADGQLHGFVWSDGEMEAVPPWPGERESGAFAINNRGEMAGYAAQIPGANIAVLWAADGPVDLGRVGMCSCPEYITAYALNDGSQVVGESLRLHVGNVAFLWQSDTLVPLYATSTGNYSGAFGINGQGQVTGYAGTRPALWSDGDLVLLGTLGGLSAAGRAINEWGWIVGASGTDPGMPAAKHAFIWQPDWDPATLGDLGTLGGLTSEALAIRGTLIVGSSQTTDGSDHAFVYDHEGPGEPVDLNDLIDADSGWVLTSATAINGTGEIAGYGTVGGEVHGFLLAPRDSKRSAQGREAGHAIEPVTP